MNGLSLCAGIDGIGLGLKIADPSYRTLCYVEREAYAAAVLVKRMEEGWLDQAPIWDDLSTFNGKRWRGFVDIIHAGLPCQPYSVAGRQQGDKDERYIWPEFFRIVREVQPALVFLENVPGLLAWFRPIGEELSTMGYEFEAGIFSAAEVGLFHERERLYILAHRNGARLSLRCNPTTNQADEGGFPAWSGSGFCGETRFPALDWSNKPYLGRGGNGLPNRVDRLRACGNGVVPLVAATAFIALAKKVKLWEED